MLALIENNTILKQVAPYGKVDLPNGDTVPRPKMA